VLKDKVVIVTGAGQGIGRGIAEKLAAEGATVVVSDLNETTAKETAAAIGGVSVQTDVTSPDSVAAAVAQVRAQFGRIDALVNNAGWDKAGPFVQSDRADWDRVVQINLYGVLNTCREVLPVMVEQGKGAIVNISSVAGMRNDFGSGRVHVGYSASKAGVIQLSRSTAGAYAKKGIRVNTVVPGLMHTPLVETRLAKTVGNNDLTALIEARHRAVPMGRMGDAWDIAHAVLFLVSDEARYITGTEIVVDGGLTAAMP
jgi:2-hydroxycyclohexanecarboxyl-CoA dehydrogenase